MINALIKLISILLLTGCVIEAGNPNGVTGDLKISWDGNGSSLGLVSSGSFEIFIDSVILYNDADNSNLSMTLKPTHESINILRNETIEFATTSEVIPGTYNNIVIIVKDSNPFKYKPDGSNEKPVRFEDSGSKAIYISGNYEIEEGQSEEIVVSLDLSNSLSESGDGFIFKPRAGAQRRKFGVSYSSTVNFDEGEVVCAYLYDAIAPPKRMGRIAKRFKKRLTPPSGFKAFTRPEFSSADDVVKDETKKCDNAFERRPVINNSFEFRHLKPGTYDFRVFKEDGSFEDIETGVRLTLNR